VNSKKTILIVFGTLILVGGVATGVYLVSKNQNIRNKAAPATNVYIEPSTQNKNPGDPFSFSVSMDTGQNQITGVDIRLNYNPGLIEVVSLNKGSGISALDSQIINTFSNTTGKISYAVYTANKANGVTGSSVEILKVNGNIINTASGNALLSFDPATVIYGVNEGQNVIIGMVPGSVVVAGATNQPTPTPTDSTASSATNSCGGTCGSNSNCKSPLLCYQGFCRNPSCSGSLNCVCSGGATSSPTPTPTNMPVPVSGSGLETIAGVVVGVFAVVGSLLLAL
jgi:hypothetical protein